MEQKDVFEPLYNRRMKKCPFCESKRVLEVNGLAYVLASDPRLTFGHLLVVPKRHIERPWELNDEEALVVWRLVVKYQKLLVERVGAGCDVRENYRPFLSQSRLKVDHVHWHLIPRTNKDEIYERSQIGEQELFEALVGGELEKLRAILLLDQV